MDEGGEGGDVGSVGAVTESSTVTITVPSGGEGLMESLNCEKRVEGSYNEEDGEEIMVEIVGSHVFVDSVSGDGDGLGNEVLGTTTESFGNDDDAVEGDMGSKEVTDLKGPVWDSRNGTGVEKQIPGSMDERAVDVVEPEEVEVASGSTSEQTHVVAVRVEESVGEKGEERGFVGGSSPGALELVGERNNTFGHTSLSKNLDDEVRNVGIGAVPSSSSLMLEAEGAKQNVVGEEAVVVVQEEHLSCKDGSLGVDSKSAVVDVTRSVSQASVQDIASHVSPEINNHVGESVGVVTTKESLCLTFGGSESNIADQNVHSSGQGDQMEDKHTGVCNTCVDNVDADLPSSFNPLKDATGGEAAAIDCKVPTSPSHEVLGNVLLDHRGGDDGEVGSSNDIVSSIEDTHISPSQSAVNDRNILASLSGNQHAPEDGPTFASNHMDVGEHESQVKTLSGIVLATEPNYSCGQTRVFEKDAVPVEKTGDTATVPEVFDDDTNEESYSEDSPVVKQEATHGSDGDMHIAPKSSPKHSSVVERGEWVGMDIDNVLDFKDEATGSDAPSGKLSSMENTACASGEPRISTNKVDVAAEIPMSDVKADVKDSRVTLCFRGDEELVQSDLGTSEEQKPVVTGDTESLAVKGGANFRQNILNADVFVQKSEKLGTFDVDGEATKDSFTEANAASSREHIGTLNPMDLSVESQGAVKVPVCDAIEQSSILAGESDLKVEDEGLNMRGDHPEGAKVATLDDSARGMESDIEAGSTQAKKQDEVALSNEKHLQEVHGNMTNDTFAANKVSNEGTYNLPISDVQVSAGPQTTDDSTCSLAEGNMASLLTDGDPESHIICVSEETSASKGDLTMGTSVHQAAISVEAFSQVVEREDESCKTDDNHIFQAAVTETMPLEDQQRIGAAEQYADGEQVEIPEQDMVIGDHAYDVDQSQILEDQRMMASSSLRICHSGYLRPPENEGEFSTSDLVWGKVRSHPWWPGQIFDTTDASDKAVKYYRKGCFLLAYFGDRTFAWNDASVLKPFRSHFSQVEKQSNSEAFQNAVSCALDEVSRRVELGLACSCIPKDTYERIECQIVENTGIREESTRRYGVDKSTGARSFEPDKLLEHLRSLAQSPFCPADQLELVLAKAQISAFCNFKGYRPPPAFDSREALSENNAGTSESSIKLDHKLPLTKNGDEVPPSTSYSHKRKQNLKDSSLSKKKERSLSELMGGTAHSPDEEDDSDGNAPSQSVSISSGKKRKAVDSITDGSDRRISIYAAKVSTTSSSPKPSFKVGDCIRKVASQLTGSASILKGSNDQPGGDASVQVSENSPRGSMGFPIEISSIEDMISQLQLAARDPKKGYSFLNNIIIFFSAFRNSVVRKHTSGKSGSGRKRKTSDAAGGLTEEFEFDDANDSYWTDRIIQNYSEEQLLQNGDGDYQLIVSEPDKFHKPTRRQRSRKQYSNGNYEMSADEPTEDVDRRKLESSPAELVLTFAEGDCPPSEIVLNKMFRRFGPLKESETEVDQDSHRARVIFKKGADAEVAYSSAGTFNIFGSMVVTYQLSYSPSTTIRPLPLLISMGQEDAD